MSLSADDTHALTEFLTSLNETTATWGISLTPDYDRDGAQRLAAYMDGEPIAFIEHRVDGYEIVGMP